MGTLQEGAKQVVVNCLAINSGEKVVMITDRECKNIADAIKNEVDKVTDTLSTFVMENYGKRPNDGSNPLKFPDELGEKLSEADVSIYCASGKKGELQTFRVPMLQKIEGNKNLRHGHMIGITENIMKDGMCSDYAQIIKLSAKVNNIVKVAKSINVKTPAGTDITAEFSPKLKWVISDGNLSKGCGKTWSNLPDGEVYTCPATINGHAVIDGCLGDFFGKYGAIKNTPVHLDLKDGRVVKGSVKCDDKDIENELNEYIFKNEDDNTNRIGEFAIGTNTGLTKIIGNLLQDEKFPSVHIAWGSSYPTHTGADWDSSQHCDGVMINTTITVDGKTTIMENGKYKI